MREVLRMVGVQDCKNWTRKKLTETLHDYGILPQDMRELSGRAAVHRSQQPRSRHRRSREVSEHVDEPSWQPQRRGRRRAPPEDEEDEWLRQVLEQEEGRSSFRGKDYYEETFYADVFDDLDDDELEEFLYGDDDDDEDYDDFYDYVLDDEPWSKKDRSRPRGRRKQPGGRNSGPGFYTYEAYQQDVGYSPTDEGYPDIDPPTWSKEAFHAAGFPFDAGFPAKAPETPDQAMTRALHEGWAPEGLSHMQASVLLGVPTVPSDAELRRAKRQSVLRWHPDRNPDNPSAGDAFRLVVAAADVLAR